MGSELFTLGISSAVGFIFKLIAQAQADRMARDEMLLKKFNAEEESRKRAAELPGGLYVRRFIVVMMIGLLVFVTIAPALLNVDTYVVTQPDGTSFLFGLFESGKELKFTPVKGVIYDDTLRQVILAIVGFYFGASAGSRR